MTKRKASNKPAPVQQPGRAVRETVGRRLSRREQEIHWDEYGYPHYLGKLDPDDYWGTRTIERHRQRASEVLKAAGIDVQEFHEDSPYGRVVLDHVLNVLGHEPDSLVGLAARIYYWCCHAIAYPTLKGGETRMPTVAYALGRLVLLFKAYEPESKAQSIKASRPRTNVTKAELVKFRTKFILDTGKARGWKPAASKNLNMDIKTLNKIWE